jgi:alkaline phosphatase D
LIEPGAPANPIEVIRSDTFRWQTPGFRFGARVMNRIADWIAHLARSTRLPGDPLGRRRFLSQAAWTATGLALAGAYARPALAQSATRVRFVAEPFTLGVASGYPHPGGFTLWTRLAPAPWLADGGIGGERIPLHCEIADDENFRSIVQAVDLEASPEVAHSVHLDVEGLSPGRSYFYRFLSGDAVSAVGRSHTLPAAGSGLDRYRIAFASCQNYEHGYFSAYRQMQADAPDLVLFLGDYIYESQWGDNPIRRHIGPEAATLEGYRLRHAQYKLDPDLQAMHLTGPWAFAWDDHEVDNDYAGDRSELLDPAFLLRRAAAYQAYFEHIPVPRRMYPRGADMRLYSHFDIGDLLRVYLLDDRQYRTPQPCPKPNKNGSQVLSTCRDLEQADQSMLGQAQEAWLAQSFRSSRARWNLIGQQTLMSPMDEEPGPGRGAWTDGWDGYPLARERLLNDVVGSRLSNPVIAGGDVHCGIVASVPGDRKRFDSKPIASEFVATSISADARPQPYYNERSAENPHIRQLRSDQRGYTLLEFGKEQLQASMQVVSDVRVREPEFAVQARYVVENGRPGPKPT